MINAAPHTSHTTATAKIKKGIKKTNTTKNPQPKTNKKGIDHQMQKNTTLAHANTRRGHHGNYTRCISLGANQNRKC